MFCNLTDSEKVVNTTNLSFLAEPPLVGGVGLSHFLTQENPIMSSSPPRERLLSRQEAAELLRLKPQTLAKWALQKRFLSVVKCGKACRYRPAEIDAFILRQTEEVK